MTKKHKVEDHYDAVAETYHLQYQKEHLHDVGRKYPANYFRMQMILNSFAREGVKRVFEVGVGEGTPLATLAKAGIDPWGIDVSKEMVKASKRTMEANGLNPDQISWGDIEDPNTYIHVLKDGRFDAAMAMGVMPHVGNDRFVLGNIATLVREGGRVFIEFRNKLFSLFTFNRMTVEFILDDLLAKADPGLKDAVRKDLESRLRMDMPPVRAAAPGSDAPGYDQIKAKFHNPFEVKDMFRSLGFRDVSLRWYHYHPAMPYLASGDEQLFRDEAIRMEHSDDWRGHFLCSAFVVEAVNGDGNAHG